MTLDQFFREGKELPSLPTVFYEIEREIDNPRSSSDSIGEILIKDPSLVSRLLALSNSAFYGFSRRVETIPNAIQLLGLKQVRDLVMATAVMDSFKGVSVDFLDMGQFWVHSIGCGVAAAALAQTKGDSNPERYFVGGLLHDIGRLALLIKLPEEMTQVLIQHRETRTSMHLLEQTVIGFDHTIVGGGLIERWRLPVTLGEMVRCHHAPDRSTYTFETSLIHIADLLVHSLNLGQSGEIQIPPFCPAAWDRLGIDLALIESIFETIESRTEQLCSIFIQK